MVTNNAITSKMIKSYKEDFSSRLKADIIANAVIKNGIQSTAINHQSVWNMRYFFSEEIKTGKVTNQEHSGRCWLFAGLNMFRHLIAKDLNIENFELSQNYLLFWDKLEKANYFLEHIIETADLSIDDRLFMWLLKDPMQDGGQWDMFSNLVKKYGVVPKNVMPETFHSSHTYHMDSLLTLKLREDAVILRKNKSKKTIHKLKDNMLSEIYRMLVHFLGKPPEIFDFEAWDDEHEKKYLDRSITPKSFFTKYTKLKLDDFVSLINAPASNKKLDEMYTVKYLGNVIEGDIIRYLNVTSQTLKNTTIKQIKDGIPVWFGCDVAQWSHYDTGIMDMDIYKYGDALDVSFGLSKGDRLIYGESQLTHAMLFTGVNIVNKKPTRWKVENSWGKKSGNKGYYIMSDAWFDNFNYQVVVHKRYLSKKHQTLLKKKPVKLPPWDPLGSLAMMRG